MQKIIKLALRNARNKYGPAPAFEPIDLLRAFFELGSSQLSRSELASRLDLGEGTARSIIRRLIGEGLAQIRKRGCVLTKRGVQEFSALRKMVREIGAIRASGITFNEKSIGLLVRGGARRVKMGIEQRDAALREGAMGATVLIKTSGLHLTGSFDDTKFITPDVEKELETVFNPASGSAIILCYAKEKLAAHRGVWAAFLTLC